MVQFPSTTDGVQITHIGQKLNHMKVNIIILPLSIHLEMKEEQNFLKQNMMN